MHRRPALRGGPRSILQSILRRIRLELERELELELLVLLPALDPLIVLEETLERPRAPCEALVAVHFPAWDELGRMRIDRAGRTDRGLGSEVRERAGCWGTRHRHGGRKRRRQIIR